jgi:hypothetical protein
MVAFISTAVRTSHPASVHCPKTVIPFILTYRACPQCVVSIPTSGKQNRKTSLFAARQELNPNMVQEIATFSLRSCADYYWSSKATTTKKNSIV